MNKQLYLHENNSMLSHTLAPAARILFTKQAKLKLNPIQEILCITSCLPRQCGIATYSDDLVTALRTQYGDSISIGICPIESDTEIHSYKEPIKYILNVDQPHSFALLAGKINTDKDIAQVLIQHEFGFFQGHEADIEFLVATVKKPVSIEFHTVLPHPNPSLKAHVSALATHCSAIIVLTKSSANLLISQYNIASEKIYVISHGTHLVPFADKEILKEKYNFTGKFVCSTFGLLSAGKSIETTLKALPDIVNVHKNVIFLIIGKTHPSVVLRHGENYRSNLEKLVRDLNLSKHVIFINAFIPLPILLEYLQLTDIYLFTSKDPNQAVSGTFSYALSCGCPIVSTPIPHAQEVLKKEVGMTFDFEDSNQLSKSVNTLIENETKCKAISINAMHFMASTAWQNSAIAHAKIFNKQVKNALTLKYQLPKINLNHFHRLTTNFGMIQFSKINQPDISTGYTIDDNARALVAICQYYELTKDHSALPLITTYIDFICFCQQEDGQFLNYVNEYKDFTLQNLETNLEDSNGRTVWALGYMVSINHLLPLHLGLLAISLFRKSLKHIQKFHSTRALAFTIKGIYYFGLKQKSKHEEVLITELADRLVQMYRHESKAKWHWFESYLTYANSTLSEAMLCAWIVTGKDKYFDIAIESFDFLLNQIFKDGSIKVISNKNWADDLPKTVEPHIGGEQPIDVAYTIISLAKFYAVTKNKLYLNRMYEAFNWFLGDNHLQQIIYNPVTGGCYDGLEEYNVNLNQGAESTVSYLMARLTIEKVNYEQCNKNGLPA